jgi:RNA polymerase sigma-70 factor (ECF subfamily)
LFPGIALEIARPLGESQAETQAVWEQFAARALLTVLCSMAGDTDFEHLVALYYEALYQFAFSLCRDEADACDLTQQTFYVWAIKGHQLRDRTKVKTWLFTTLHRQFLETRRRATRFPQSQLDEVETELLSTPAAFERLDGSVVVHALARVDEVYQAPVALFYLQDFAYREIAEILNVPIGTVKSRMARGIAQLQQLLADDLSPGRSSKGGAP